MLEKLFRLESGELIIPSGSVLVCYTDGLVEQEDDSGTDLCIDNLTELIEQNSNKTAEQINALLLQNLVSYKGNQPYVDDIALLTCRFH
jgi:serine phosphatase RsbU (regulator of sigma subunit)